MIQQTAGYLSELSGIQAAPGLNACRALVLNADAQPLSTFPLSTWGWREAVEAIYRGRVTALENWEGREIRSARHSFPVPKVVMHNTYVPMRKKKVALSRLTLALRDKFCCGYCGKRFPMRDLTFDHVVPRARGGKNIATNLLMACVPCNRMKGSSPINPNGRKGVVRPGNFVPLKMPHQPTFEELYKIGIEFIPAELHRIYGDWLPKGAQHYATEPQAGDHQPKDNWADSGDYWTIELEP